MTGALVPSQGLPHVRGRGAATNLRLKTLEKQAPDGPPLVTFECVPALDVKTLLRYVPRPPTLTYVLLTYVFEMPDTIFRAPRGSREASTCHEAKIAARQVLPLNYLHRGGNVETGINLYRANGRGRFGGQTAGGDPKAFPRLKQPLFAVPALRELESACRVSIL